MTILLQQDKGTLLTPLEADENIRHLRDHDDLNVPKSKAFGIKVGSESPGTETFGWHDLTGQLDVYGEVGDATRVAYVGGIKALQFDVGDSAYIDFHLPHDYASGTQIHIHTHWSVDGSVTSGDVTWEYEMIYAKGHQQAAFPGTTVTATSQQAGSATTRMHMVSETVASVVGGSAVALDTDQLEVDGLIQVRIGLTANTLSPALNPFVHAVDIHYQSTGVPTKQKAPDFWT